MTTALPQSSSLPDSILVIDDSSVQRQHAVSLCADLGISRIHEASHGAEALEVLAALPQPPSVLIIDLEMPGMNGVELIQNLHKRGTNIPLIVASSRENPLINAVETMAQALGMEILAGLQKPLNLMQIAAALSSRCPSKQPASATNQITFTANDLRGALEDKALLPYYQPKLDVRTGVIKGTEALARWILPDGRMIPPDQFIAVAEQNDLIQPLTLSIADQACAQAAQWNKRGLRLSMAINLSPQLHGRRPVRR